MIRYLEKKEDFEKIINEDKVLVDFFAEWCGPCKKMGEVLENMDVNVLKVNTDLFQEIAFSFGIMSIPTLIRFDKGEIVKKEIGFRTKEEIEEIMK